MGVPRYKSWLMTVVGLLAIAAAGCLVKKDSPAPGCIEYWGPAPMGGCFGTTAILNLRVEPDMDCLEIRVNNCNGGVLQVSNACQDSIVLAQIEIGPGDRYVTLDVDKQNGEYVLRHAHGNFSEYIPSEDAFVEIRGMLGRQEVTISFVKTKRLC